MIAALLFLLASTELSAEDQLRAEAIYEDLRCVVCQNQSIAESDAEIAQIMRRLVDERIAAGDNDAEAKAYVVARYGEYVLLSPSGSAKNLGLWAGPVIALTIGAFWAFSLFRRSAKS